MFAIRRLVQARFSLIILLLVLLSLMPLVSEQFAHILIYAYIFAIAAFGLDLILGYTGMMNFGHAGFVGIGAYISGMASIYLPLPPWLTIFAGGAIAALGGLFIGAITLRFKEPFPLAITTMAFNEILRVIIRNQIITGGPLGLTGIPSLPSITLPFLTIDFTRRISYCYVTQVFALVSLYIIYKFVNTRFGVTFAAIREDPVAAETLGINLAKYKLVSFCVGTFFAGIAGGLYAHYMRIVSIELMAGYQTLMYISMVVAGGMGTMIGPFIGAIILTFLSEMARFVLVYWAIVYGAIVIAFILLAPGGTMDIISRTAKFFKKSRVGTG